MTSRKSIKIKAALLLTVFTLNTLISFACSVGIDMGFNHNRHADEKKSHSHSNKHSHKSHSRKTAHNHSKATAHNNSHDVADNDHKDPNRKDGCCNDKSVELQKIDKSSNHSSNPVIKIPVFVAFLAAFSGLELKGQLSPLSNKVFIPQYYPPPDKRIIIQSFQI